MNKLQRKALIAMQKELAETIQERNNLQTPMAKEHYVNVRLVERLGSLRMWAEAILEGE